MTQPRKGPWIDQCDRCDGPIYQGVQHTCGASVNHNAVCDSNQVENGTQTVWQRRVAEEIATIKEDIAMILDRLERLEQ